MYLRVKQENRDFVFAQASKVGKEGISAAEWMDEMLDKMRGGRASI